MDQSTPTQAPPSEVTSFLNGIAKGAKVSSSKQRIVLARKLCELKRLKGTMRTKQHRIKKMVNELKTLEGQKFILEATIKVLEQEINNGTDDEAD